MTEIELSGGNITAGIVRIDGTVRRPRHHRSAWVSRVLRHLEDAGYPYAPRARGTDDQGRDVLTYVPGTTTDHPSQRRPGAYGRGGEMLRRLHDLTTGSALLAEWPGPPSDATCVVHGDCGAYNTIFDDGLPVALIDWDSARPGDPLDDLALMTWTWCIQSAGNVAIADQARHVAELRDGYDSDIAPDVLVDAVLRTQQRMVDVETRVRADPGTTPTRRAHAATAAAWAATDRDLLARHRAAFVYALGR